MTDGYIFVQNKRNCYGRTIAVKWTAMLVKIWWADKKMVIILKNKSAAISVKILEIVGIQSWSTVKSIFTSNTA